MKTVRPLYHDNEVRRVTPRLLDFFEYRLVGMRGVSGSLAEIVDRARKVGRLSSEECVLLSDTLSRWLSLDDCKASLAVEEIHPMEGATGVMYDAYYLKDDERSLDANFYEEDWSFDANLRKLAEYRAAVFVDLFRPTEVDWRTPFAPDMERIRSFAKRFSNCETEDKLPIVGDLFNLSVKFDDISSSERERSSSLTLDDWRFLRATTDLPYPNYAYKFEERKPTAFRPYRGQSNLSIVQSKDRRLQKAYQEHVRRLRVKAPRELAKYGE